MGNEQWSETDNRDPRLSLEKAEEILRNVYRAAGISPPENCAEILRRGARGVQKRRQRQPE